MSFPFVTYFKYSMRQEVVQVILFSTVFEPIVPSIVAYGHVRRSKGGVRSWPDKVALPQGEARTARERQLLLALKSRGARLGGMVSTSELL